MKYIEKNLELTQHQTFLINLLIRRIKKFNMVNLHEISFVSNSNAFDSIGVVEKKN